MMIKKNTKEENILDFYVSKNALFIGKQLNAVKCTVQDTVSVDSKEFHGKSSFTQNHSFLYYTTSVFLLL